MSKESKTNTQLLKEMQDIADEIAKRKAEVEVILAVIDELEAKYHDIAETIRKNVKTNA